ncbi:UNVERIFIED_CONTAM: molybdate transport system ATP-binding protein [Acetivibrio alkalicellulosi]
MLELLIKKTLGNFSLQSTFTAKNGVLGILGPSGCGKSMTLKCIAGLQTPDSGLIRLNDKLLFSSEFKIDIPSRKRNIGYVFQHYALFPHMTVMNNIGYGVKHLEKKQRIQKIKRMIERMQLDGLEDHYPSQLSGGQQQRTALARTLITEPDLLLLDEPFSALDSHIKHLLEKELISIIKNNFDGIVLLVTHNIEEAYRICDHIMIMDKGNNLQYGTKDDIVHTPANLTTARITGCKNLLDVTVLKETDQHLILKSNELIFKAIKPKLKPSKIKVAGIRSHHISFCSDSHNNDNTFECTIIDKINGVFSTIIVVNCKRCILQVELSKMSCPHIHKCNSSKLMLHIPPHQVFVMDKDE